MDNSRLQGGANPSCCPAAEEGRKPSGPMPGFHMVCQNPSCDHLASSGILDIMNHVDSLSLPDDLKARLHECLEQLTIRSTQAIKIIKAGQVLHNLPAYMSPADWTHLESNATIYDHMHVIAKRLATMGVVSLRETSKARAVALALYCQSQLGKPEPNAMVIHSCLADFQSLHTQCLSTMHQQIAGPKTYIPKQPSGDGCHMVAKGIR